MSTNDELKALLGAKFTPDTHDYVITPRRQSLAKRQEGWAVAGELTNHGEVMIVLSKSKVPTPTPKGTPT